MTGRCLCGAVEFAVDEPFIRAGYCHCTNCKKISGGGGTVSGRVRTNAIRILAGEEHVRTFQPAEGTAKSFCGICGSATESFRAGWGRRCGGCGAEHFPRVDPVVIMLAEHDGRVLVARQPQYPAGRYSALAGFVEPGESIEEAVARELMEEAGIEAFDVRFEEKDLRAVLEHLRQRYGKPDTEGQEVFRRRGDARTVYKVRWEKGQDRAVLSSIAGRRRVDLNVWRGNFDIEIYRFK